MIPQIIMISVMFISLLLEANRHGKPRGKHNIWVSIVGAALSTMLLTWGGFYDPLLK